MGQSFRVYGSPKYWRPPNGTDTALDFAYMIGMFVPGEVQCTPGGGCTEAAPYCECDSGLPGIPAAKFRRYKTWIVSEREVRAALDTYERWTNRVADQAMFDHPLDDEEVAVLAKMSTSRAKKALASFINFLHEAEADGFWVLD